MAILTTKKIPALEALKYVDEHIFHELVQLEAIYDAEEVNTGSLLHVLEVLPSYWNAREAQIEKIKAILESEGYRTEVHTFTFESPRIKRHIDALMKAVSKGSERELRHAVDNEMRVVSDILKNQIELEEWMFCTVNWQGLKTKSQEALS